LGKRPMGARKQSSPKQEAICTRGRGGEGDLLLGFPFRGLSVNRLSLLFCVSLSEKTAGTHGGQMERDKTILSPSASWEVPLHPQIFQLVCAYRLYL
jgi:hypothetical protein